MNSKPVVFSKVKIVLPDSVVPGNVLIENGVIAAVNETSDVDASFPPEWEMKKPDIVDGGGDYLSPGFIDIHNHGRLGCDVMDGKSTSMDTIAKCHAGHGVTSFLAGTSSIPWEKSLEAIRFIAGYCKEETERAASSAGEGVPCKGARCLGIYSEGNFFSMEKRGAHNPKYLKTALEKEDLDALLEAAGEALKVVALSPELPGAEEWIKALKSRGVVVSAAHSNATYDETMAGIKLGVTLSTHTFNGMRGLTHQDPGILGAVLDDSRVCCELIADGIHLKPVILSLVHKLKGPDRVILISDSVIAGGLPDGCYEKGGYTVFVKDGVIRLENGTLSGSSLSLDKAVYNMVSLAGVSLPHAVRAASLNPARVLGLDGTKGSIEPGKDADLVLFDENIQIRKVFLSGVPFFE